MPANINKFSQKSTPKKDRSSAPSEKFDTHANSYSVDGGFGVFSYASKPEASIFGKKSINLEQFVESVCETCKDAAKFPDVLQIVYTFNFPEACEQFAKLFSTDFYFLNAYQFTQASNQVNVMTNGFAQYVLRCPFIPKALCISLDADAYCYTMPVAEVPADSENVPPYASAHGVDNPESITGRIIGNAIFRHGFCTNLVKQFILMCMGLRVEFNCNNVIVREYMRSVGIQCSNYANEGSESVDTPLEDLRDLNEQLANMKADFRVVPADNAQGSCENDVLSTAFSPQVSAVGNNFCGEGDGCVPMPCVPLMPGMGIDIILYTLPGMEESRNDLLRQACMNLINPGGDLPSDIVATNLTVLWTGSNPIFIVHGDQITQVNVNEPIPLNLLYLEQTTPGVPGTFVVRTKFPSQVATSFSVTGTFNAPETILTTVQVLHTKYNVGSALQRVINHGRLQLACTITGCYISRSDLIKYFTKFAVNNEHLRTLMLETREVRDVLDLMVRDHYQKYGLNKQEVATVGVGALPELKKLSKELENREDELPIQQRVCGIGTARAIRRKLIR